MVRVFRQVKQLWCLGTLLSLAAIVSLASFNVASAAPPKTALAISPPLFELSANPGDTLRHTIRVDNLTDVALPIDLSRKDFVALGEEGQASLTEQATEYSLSSWVKLDEEKFTLAPKESKTVSFRIEVPQKAEPGGHFGSVVFRASIPETMQSTGIGVGQEIGALLLLKVSGTVREEASIASFKSTKDMWEGGPIRFETRFRNAGNVQLKPSGTITISNMFGQKVGNASLESHTVLPQSIRKLASEWQGTGWPGWYTATVSVGYGSKGQLLTSSKTFIIFPYKIIIPILVFVLLFGFLIFKARKRIWRSMKILAGKE